MAASEAIQTISRLTPLSDVLLMIDAEVKPVTPRTIDVAAAAGRARRLIVHRLSFVIVLVIVGRSGADTAGPV